jgi:hypothetical protein
MTSRHPFGGGRPAARGGGAGRLIICTGGAALPAGPEANAYVNLVIAGATVKCPGCRAGAGVGQVGVRARNRNFLLYLGTVKTT